MLKQRYITTNLLNERGGTSKALALPVPESASL